ncbi:MAG: hypothetical protein J0I99_01295 [Devosia sp.]|uniref:hypothetical protein n=1 Tax=Devosia sp. TaxID=1871048 RepID=UPI001AD4720B|nr:hypothetical protein [Devosia sp.]MBN9314353.1 hypothetical protein [Devosia sp.]
MKNIVALALVAASLVAFPVITPSLAVDTSISALCGPDGPESYKRPGGYCDQVGSNKSLVEPQNAGCYGGVVSTVEWAPDGCYDGEWPL